MSAPSLADGRGRLLDELRSKPEGLAWCHRYTEWVDALIRSTASEVAAEHPGAHVSIVATGGYGRREMSPWSDVDLTVVPGLEPSPSADRMVRQLYLTLQDRLRHLGIGLGYALRLVNDAPALDGKTRTGLLDARFVAGDPAPLEKLREAMAVSFPVGEFLLDKVQERAAEREKTNDTPLVVEPHLKLGAGGLRDFHAANWVRMALGRSPLPPGEGFERILAMRNLLHMVSGKSQDVLTRPKQAEIADLLSSTPFELVAEVARAGLGLAALYEQALFDIRQSAFEVQQGAWSRNGVLQADAPLSAGAACGAIATSTRLGLRVPSDPMPIANLDDGAEVLHALGLGEPTLRNIHRCGVLAHILPELTSCETLIPPDGSHRYTVFEHTLRVARNLDEAGDHPFYGGLKAALAEPSHLYLGALLHDVGKSDPEAVHEELGASMAATVCDRLRLTHAVRERVVWLVRKHLVMAHFIRMRHSAQPGTARDLAAEVGDVDRLNMLTLLTWADVAAVAPGVWTPMNDAIVKDLYERTAALLEGELPVNDAATVRRQLVRRIRQEQADPSAIETFLEALPTDYLVSTPPETVRLHIEFERAAREGTPTVDLLPVPETATSEITVVAQDHPGLLSEVLGTLYAHDLSLHAIRAATSETDVPVAIDVFTVSFGGREVPRATSALVLGNLLEVLQGDLSPSDLLRAKGKDPDRKQQVFTYSFVPGLPAILEIQAPRGRGMAYRLSRLMAAQGWNVSSAKVGQWAGNGTAAFYLTDHGGRELSRAAVERVLSQV